MVLLALALTMLFGFIGLAVDGGEVLSDRRHAQSTADSAALAAALARSYNQNYRDAAIYAVHNNGYQEGVDSQLTVNRPPVDGTYSCDIRPDCDNFIQIVFTTHVNTSFASALGFQSFTNVVTAVAQGLKSTQEPFYNGAAVVALNPDVCRAADFNGNGNTVIDGAGIYVNSTCNKSPASSPEKAFFLGGNGNLQASYVKVVGGAYAETDRMNLDSPLATGVFALPDIKNAYILPSPMCGGAGGVDPLNPTVAQPGVYSDFPPNSVNSMEPGIYCVDSLHINGNLTGENVMFVLSGGVNMNGHAAIHLTGRTQGEFKGMLMYMLPSHAQNITINGNSSSEFSGLILAPRSQVTVNGTGKVGHFVGQIVADTVYFSGNSQMNITYDENAVYWPFTTPRVELVH